MFVLRAPVGIDFTIGRIGCTIRSAIHEVDGTSSLMMESQQIHTVKLTDSELACNKALIFLEIPLALDSVEHNFFLWRHNSSTEELSANV